MVSNGYVVQIVKPQAGVNPENYKNPETKTYSFPYVVELTLPMPMWDGFNTQHSVLVDGGRNAMGDFEGTEISAKLKISPFQWRGLSGEEAKPILQYFTQKGNFMFFARYFDLISQEFVIRKFYRGDLKVDPHIFIPIKDEQGNIISGKIDFYKLIQMDLIEV